MFNKNFYPTPRHVISKMLEEIDIYRIGSILEPSAGKGDIVTYLKETKSFRGSIDCIELEQDLRFILQEKGYSVVDKDFLRYHSNKIYDLIVMNPPFDNGVKHFLKAWEISRNTEIRCLLNEENITNPYSEERKLLQNIITDNKGTVEFLEDCFSGSERSTNVRVVLIKVKKVVEDNGFIFHDNKFKFENQEQLNEIDDNQVAKIDKLESMIDSYNAVSELSLQMFSIMQQMKKIGNAHMTNIYGNISNILEKSFNSNITTYYNEFNSKLKEAYWNEVFNKTKISDKVTSKVREDFFKFKDKQTNLSFNKENIEELFETLFVNRENIMEKCIEEAFDYFTKYYKENRIHIEGWQTNDRWQVNKKVILPCARDTFYNYPYINSTMKDKLNDVEKALCFISGKKYDESKAIKSKYDEFGVWYETDFFNLKLFKKGTIHLEFRDDYIWTQFNLTACKYRNWLVNKGGANK